MLLLVPPREEALRSRNWYTSTTRYYSLLFVARNTVREILVHAANVGYCCVYSATNKPHAQYYTDFVVRAVGMNTVRYDSSPAPVFLRIRTVAGGRLSL